MGFLNVKYNQIKNNKYQLMFVYQIHSDFEDTIQKSYQLQIFDDAYEIFNTGIVLSNQNTCIECCCNKLKKNNNYQYVLKVETNHEMIEHCGKVKIDNLFLKWTSKWEECNEETAFSRNIKISGSPVRAVLYASCNHIVSPILNGIELNCYSVEQFTVDGVHSYDVTQFLKKGNNNLQFFYKKIFSETVAILYELHIDLPGGKTKIYKSKGNKKTKFYPLPYKFCLMDKLLYFKKVYTKGSEVYDCGKMVFGNITLKNSILNDNKLVVVSETIDFNKPMIINLDEENYLKFYKFRYFKFDDDHMSTYIYVHDYSFRFNRKLIFESSNAILNNLMNYTMENLRLEYSQKLYSSLLTDLEEISYFTNYLLMCCDDYVEKTVLKAIDNFDLSEIENKVPLTGLFSFEESVWNIYKFTNNKEFLKQNFSKIKALIRNVDTESFTYPEVELCMYYYYLNVALQIGELQEDDKFVNKCLREMRKISERYCKKYWPKETDFDSVNIVAYAFFIVSGISSSAGKYIDSGLLEILKLKIKRKEFGEEVLSYLPIIVEALLICGDEKTAIELLEEYGDTINNQLTDFTSILFLLFIKKALIGIYDSPSKTGQTHIILKPYNTNIITLINTVLHLNEGNLIYKYHLCNDILKITIDVPVNMIVTVIMPNGKINNLKSGKYYLNNLNNIIN